MNKVLKTSLAVALLVVFTCFMGTQAMDTLISSYEVPVYQVVFRGLWSRHRDHIVSLRYFNDTVFTCTQNQLDGLRKLKSFFKTTEDYVQEYDLDSVAEVKEYAAKFQDDGYEVMYTFRAQPRSRL